MDDFDDLVDDYGEDAVRAFIGRFGYGGSWKSEENVELVESHFTDAFQGAWDSMEDYAYDFAESTGMLAEVPESLVYYFDFKAYGRDMELSGDVSYEDGYVFLTSW